MKSLTDFTFPSENYFQSAVMYSNDAKPFRTGNDVAFLLLNNTEFNLLSGGSVASVVGSVSDGMVGSVHRC